MNETSNSTQRTSKRRIACPDNGILTLPQMPLTSDAMHTTPEETQYHPPEQSQQSSASRDPSLKHILIHTNPPHSFGYKVSSGGCDGTNTNSTSGMTTDGTTHQSFSHVSFSQSNPMQGAPGSILSQDLQYSNQSKTPPISREGERNPQSTNVSAVRLYDPGSGSGHTANDGSCIPWFPDFGITLGAEAPDINSHTEPTADSGSCIPWFPDFDSTLGAADAGSCIPWFPDFNDPPGSEAPGSTAGVGNYVQGFEPNI